ncbi:hypothetical protein TNCT_577161 [Trichonephila clavata]|uniref:Uncharacterized protein n=1 Tax=Trichonephila clavata TaxID=2740835 RepID=A0A8X6LRI3_TRICU|nr:hypothetical protein TNCT_577161 [Trichonephila clavata]
MAYLGKGRREDLFVLATELNLKFNKSMTIATLKDLITSSEEYDEELTKNLHTTIVEDRKSNEERMHIEEQKLRTEEQEQKLRIEEREERIRIEELRIDEQKRKDEFELKKLRIQAQSNLGAATSEAFTELQYSTCMCALYVFSSNGEYGTTQRLSTSLVLVSIFSVMDFQPSAVDRRR